MKSASLYIFIALGGALLISCTSAASISGSTLQQGRQTLVSSNELAEAQRSNSQIIENQVDALVQVAYNGAQAFFDGVNEALAEEKKRGSSGQSNMDASNLKAHDAAEYTPLFLTLIKPFMGGKKGGKKGGKEGK